MAGRPDRRTAERGCSAVALADEHSSFAQVRDGIARFERRSFLEHVARIGVEISGETFAKVRISDGREMLVAHHFLARVALVSALFGRERGRVASRDDVLEACARWNAQDDPFLLAAEVATISDVHSVMIRTSWDQFPVQERPQDNIRIWFGIYRRAREAGVLNEVFDVLWHRTFGLGLYDWYQAGLVFWLLTVVPSLPPEAVGLPPGAHGLGMEPVVAIGELRARARRFGAAARNLEAVVNDLSQTRDELTTRYTSTQPADPVLERYAVNPLASRPILRIDTTHYIVPVARLFGNAMGMATLYRIMEADSDFPAAFGGAFEHYVGETFRASFADVLPEETYRVGKDQWSGFDWTVIEPDYALLVECKTPRILVGAKTSGDLEDVVAGLKRIVSEPAGKMDAKVDHIRRGLTQRTPDTLDRPVHRLIVTLEHMHLESLYTELAGYDPRDADTPILVSIAGLQRLLSVDGKSIHELIEEFRVGYTPGVSGSIDQWLRSHPEHADQIRTHPVPAEDRSVLLPPAPPLDVPDQEVSALIEQTNLRPRPGR